MKQTNKAKGNPQKELRKKLVGISKFIEMAQEEGVLRDSLESLLTPAEIEQLHERLCIFEGLDEGLTQRTVAKKTGAAIATVSRGARVLQDSVWWGRLGWRS